LRVGAVGIVPEKASLVWWTIFGTFSNSNLPYGLSTHPNLPLTYI
jgi:hypothetical protein